MVTNRTNQMSRGHLLSIDEVADYLGISPRTLMDRNYRNRIGLAGVRIGRRIRFAEEDLFKFIKRSREMSVTQDTK